MQPSLILSLLPISPATMKPTVSPPHHWQHLRVVETIYEEDSSQDSSSTTPSISSPPPPSAASLPSRVKLWSFNNEVETDVLIHVGGTSFRLHKDPLARCSGYLKRQLTESSEITISPPLKITPDTFTLVVDHCYGGHLFITPFNVASLSLAAELLEMTNNSHNLHNLRQKTESYFRRTVAADRNYAAVVLKSCIGLLPDVQTKTGLVSMCIEAMKLNGEFAFAGDVSSLFDGVQELSGEEFRSVIASLHQRLNRSHDLLYRIIDFYFKVADAKMTEEERSKICNYIDCSDLSSETLMHAVQNPRMPLRFVVQAMFIEQLNTRHSVFSAAAQTLKTRTHRPIKQRVGGGTASVTLGAILQRDAVIRQVVQLRDTMDYTSSRIESLEKEINGMRNILNIPNTGHVTDNRVKSESFRFSSERKVERGQRGSVSSSSFRVVERGQRESVSSGSFRVLDIGSESDHSCDLESPRPRPFGKWVMNGLKSVFRRSGLGGSRNEVSMENISR